jgi:hypothetical protein
VTTITDDVPHRVSFITVPCDELGLIVIDCPAVWRKNVAERRLSEAQFPPVETHTP